MSESRTTAGAATILVVDDDPILLRGVSRLFRKAGYEVIEAMDGRRALRLLREQAPEIVVLDVVLPDVNGIEICRRIKEDKTFIGVYVILVSGIETESESQAAGLEAGADDYVARPVSNRELLARVEALLRIKRADDALRESEERFKSIFENATIGLYRTTPDGRILMANPMLVGMLGYSCFEELAECELSETGFEPGYPRSVFLQRIESEGKVIGLESSWTRQDGVKIFVRESATAVRDEAGNTLYYEGTVEDITGRKRAEGELRRKSEAMETSTEGIAILDADGKYTYLNAAHAKIYGYDRPDELVGKSWQVLYNEPEIQRFLNEIMSDLQQKCAWRGEVVGLKKDGSSFPQVVSLTAMDGGGYICVVQDITERKLAEKALRKSEKRLIAAQRIAKVGDFTWDVETGKVTWSEGLYDLLGYDKSEKINYPKVNAEIHHPDDLERVTKWLNDCIESGSNDLKPNEYRLVRKDGETIFVRTVGIIERDMGNVKVFATLQDITKRKRAEKKIENLNSLLRSIRDVNQLIVQENDLQALMQGACEILQQTRDYRNIEIALLDEATDRIKPVANSGIRSLRDWKTSPAGEGRVPRCIQECLHIRQTVTVQEPDRYCAGCDYYDEHAKYETLVAPIMQEEQPIGCLSAALLPEHEVSSEEIELLEEIAGDLGFALEKYRAEEALREHSGRLEEMVKERTAQLRESEEKMRAQYKGIPVPTYTWQKAREDFVLVDYNDAAEAITQGEIANFVGTKLDDLHRETPEVREDIERCYTEKTTIERETSYRYVSTGESKYLAVKYAFVPPDLVLVHTEDVTERKEMQERLMRQERLAVLGQLAGGVGHELRNPLGAIKNAAYFLRMALDELEPEVKETLEILDKEVNRSERIIGTLLDFAHTKLPTRRRVKVNEIVEKALSNARIPENVEVVKRLGGNLSPISSDPHQLDQVFGNLIRNAIQAMPDGGRLTVETAEISGKSPRSAGVTVSITDTGVGIPGKNRERIFEPFFTTRPQGIGLGLALVKTLIERQSGTVDVESSVGQGSTFTVYLPTGVSSEEA